MTGNCTAQTAHGVRVRWGCPLLLLLTHRVQDKWLAERSHLLLERKGRI